MGQVKILETSLIHQERTIFQRWQQLISCFSNLNWKITCLSCKCKTRWTQEARQIQRYLQINLGSFSSVCHFFGYQGRCAIPSPFDRNVAFTYGRIARIMVEQNLSGYCSSARGLVENPSSWFPLAIPISHICHLK